LKLVGIAMVRNEADILEAFVRHNLTVLDRLLIVDHASMDGSEQILASLVREGLPLVALRSEDEGFPQPAATNAQARNAFADEGADFVIPLDADEFLKVPSRPALEAALAALPPGHHARLAWQTYVPDFAAEPSPLAALTTARRVASERHGLTKVIVARSFAAQPQAMVEFGHHAVRAPDAQTLAPHALLPAATAAIAHVPIRSASQYAAKTAIGWLAKLGSPAPEAGQSFQWRESFGYLRSGRPLTPVHLATVAANYSVPPERWLPPDAVPLVADPFLAATEQSYAQFGVSDPLALVLTFIERGLAARDAGRAG
jgi:hypothetical protein